jgi:carboxylesterase
MRLITLQKAFPFLGLGLNECRMADDVPQDLHISRSSWPPPGLPLSSLLVSPKDLVFEKGTPGKGTQEQGTEPTGYALLLHGLTGTPLEMLPLARHLSQLGIESSIPLLPGHGASLAELSKTRIQDWITYSEQELRLVGERSGGKSVIVCGLSFGAILTLKLLQSHPQLVSAAALLSPPIALRSAENERLLSLLQILPEAALSYLGLKNKKGRRANYLSEVHYAFPQHSLGAAIRLIKIRNKLLKVPPVWTKPILLGLDPSDHLVDAQKALGWFKAHFPHGTVAQLLGGEHELTLGHRKVEIFDAVARLFAQA